MNDSNLSGADEAFARELRKAREERGMSQAAVTQHMAGHFDWNATTLSKVERAQRKVTVGEAAALAQLLGKSIESLTMTGRGGIDARWADVFAAAYFAGTTVQGIAGPLEMIEGAIGELKFAMAALSEEQERGGSSIVVTAGPRKSATPTAVYEPLLELEEAVGGLRRSLAAFATEARESGLDKHLGLQFGALARGGRDDG